MPTVMITCPKTKESVSTGMAMDKASFDGSTLAGNTIKCPACGEKHTWSKEDAFLADEEAGG